MNTHQIDSLPGPENVFHETAWESYGKVLIVEDERDMAELLAYRLEKSHYSTVMAEDGATACHLIDAIRPDLALLDIMLPDKNGWQICEYIRTHEDEAVASTPVIMLTALGELNNKLKGMALGADAYIPKPYSIKEVLLHCDRLITAKKQKMALQKELSHLRAQEQGNIDLQSMLLHELNSQFVIIGGLCRKLQQNLDAGGSEKNRLYLDKVTKSISHLSTIADELLLIRKIDAGDVSLPRENFNFPKLFQSVVAMHRQGAGAKGILLQESIIEMGNIHANKVALRLIISNLLENAIKYCGNGAQVRCQARMNLDTGEAMIDVSDNGPGIPHHEQERIFERYYRGKHVRDSIRGNGIGLFAVRKLAEAMGGKASVISSAGNGSRFLVRFRVEP
jgi:two-component system sensor histidine kinase/response regulator